MLPRDLTADQFAGYPPEARKLAVANLDTLRRLPLSFLPSLLREIAGFDYKFPAERRAVTGELSVLSGLTPAQIAEWFQAFSQLSVSPKLEQSDWPGHPGKFVEQQSEYLWSTHQLDAFRRAATEYGDRIHAAIPPEPPPINRLGIAIIGQGVASTGEPLFRNLRKHGTYFAQVKPDNGVRVLLEAVAARAAAHPLPYGHWYIDGGQPAEHSPALICVSWHGLEALRAALLRNMQAQIARPGMGPEELRTYLAQLTPADLGMDRSADPVLSYFQLKVFTEGSGTQIFSTTFAQWTAREALRRAQPVTMLVRFGVRQRQRPMNELFSKVDASAPDPAGSLIDGDMGAYYNWINQQRLPGSERSCFLVWFEGHNQAVAVSPSLAPGTQSTSAATLTDLLTWVTA
ncbi:MAG: hypothetical protein JOZ83_17070 [Silvibacterium sp.]|nr:hypothetical protein [Silvibacterium sp.]